MALMLKNARLIDPQIGLDEVADILIRDGKIVEVGHDLAMEKGVERDLAGKIVTPGLVDMHVHFRDPGQEQKEDIASGSRAAAHGGFTAVCTMPNTSPVVDDAVAVEYVKARAAAVGKCRVVVAGACSKDLKGEVLSDMGDMYAHGAPVFTDDGHGIQDAGMMRRVMDYANQFDTVVMAHCQDDSLVADGQVNEGVASTRLGMVGWPAEGEELEIARDIALCRLTGCPLHIQHITTKRGLDLVRRREGRGPAGHLRGDPAPHVPHRGRHRRRVPDRPQGEPAAAHRRGCRRAHRGRRERHHRRHRHRPRARTPIGRRTASSSWRPSA